MPNRFAGLATQDWNPIVLNKPKPKAQDLRDPKAVNKALRTGAQVETVKKHTAGQNKKTAAAPVVDARKLDAAAEPASLERVATEVRQAIQKARIEKKLSQAELAKQINERTQVVQEYENGKAVPNQVVLGKMEKVLGVKLRGKANHK
ncbi:Multiprotein-bridging factor 1c [Heracleum sosnowskyi]|uniref:Multiprotein-bridging factor 1c n=1 Tax=Heracleum sosnowskyi TaxID=360622 RepID=A0AAD8HFT1_9APIA|nr:Multiprotein-bridging factor 1c [Heracleum sosnowskyi]